MLHSKFVIIRYGKQTEKQQLKEWAERFLDYAILSTNIYFKEIDDPDFIPIKEWKQLDHHLLPAIPPASRKTQRTIHGLKYQVWYREYNETMQAVLVFKGTTFTFLNDWICNLRWFTMNPISKHLFHYLLWDYYHQVQVLTPIILERVKNALGHKQIEFISTGHSLGGGLAQQAAYCVNDIKKVIVFDSSPVTGYKDIKKITRLTNQVGIETSRVFHRGEVLSYIRNFIRVFILPLSTQNPSIKEFQFSFFKGSAIKKHNMRDFAIYLAKVARS